MITQAKANPTIGLMLSGGIDSAILLAQLLDQGSRVQPFYVSTGSAWDSEERLAVQRLTQALDDRLLAPVIDLEMLVHDLYGQHWSLTGQDVPDRNTDDAAVELLGRNPLLLLKAMLWCGQNEIHQLALATLSANPFADATPEFFRQFEQTMATATGTRVEILCPFGTKTKSEILSMAGSLSLDLTFSCLAPRGGLHCGACNKCAERSRALQSLLTGDTTIYATDCIAAKS